MAEPRALVLLLLVILLCVFDCEAGKKKKPCKYNKKKYQAGEVIESLADGCIELKCSDKGKKTELNLEENCTCDRESNTPAPPTAAPPTVAPPPTGTSDVLFTIVNRCSQDLWIGADGRSNSRPTFVFNGLNFHTPKNGGWHMPEGDTTVVSVPFDFFGARFWARTGCTGTPNVDFHCETGHCGPWIECATGNVPRGGVPPATLAEFTLNANNKDYYDISLVDGFNLPMTISVDTVDASEPNANEFWCNDPKCKFDINSICPPELSVTGASGTVACFSACAKFNTNEYCCRGPYGLPSTCTADNWPVDYPNEVFEAHCPEAYSYAYDDESSTFTCRHTNYNIYFC